MKNKQIILNKIKGNFSSQPEYVYNHPYLNDMLTKAVVTRKEKMEIENYKQKVFLT